jgi:penicillin-binding protein 2
MRVALLKDPEIRAQIERPMPMPQIPNDAQLGEVPEAPTELPGAPAATAPTSPAAAGQPT